MKLSDKQARTAATFLVLSFGGLALPKPSFASLNHAPSLSRPFSFDADLGSEARPFFSFLPQFKAISPNTDLISFNLTSSEMTALVDSGINLVESGQVSLNKLSERDAASAGHLIRESVDQMIQGQPKNAKIGTFEKQWVTAEVVCELVKRSVSYDYNLADNPDTKYKEKMSLSANILGQPDRLDKASFLL